MHYFEDPKNYTWYNFQLVIRTFRTILMPTKFSPGLLPRDPDVGPGFYSFSFFTRVDQKLCGLPKTIFIKILRYGVGPYLRESFHVRSFNATHTIYKTLCKNVTTRTEKFTGEIQKLQCQSQDCLGMFESGREILIRDQRTAKRTP